MKKNNESYVPDTSVLIERLISAMIDQGEIKGKVIIPHAVIAELENQANRGQDIGFSGLEEIQTIREIGKKKKVELEFVGDRPTETQIKRAKSGEIDAYIRELAYTTQSTLITADRVQAESAKAFGIEVKYIEVVKYKEKLSLEKFLDNQTMSLHLMEGCYPLGKKGKPGAWDLVKLGDKKLTIEEMKEYAKEIAEKTRMDARSFVEITTRSTTIVQYKNLRIVIVRPPVANKWEITVVHPLKKLTLEEYQVPQDLYDRIMTKARGLVVCGETGSGKSTFAQAIAEKYTSMNRIVKTVESPRDLQLQQEVTQYSKNFAKEGEIHDILFLSRPDNVLFDEMRSTPDFELYSDLRLGGSNMIGVLHASQPIDAIQRFISRLDTGVIPNVVDTIIFMEAGKIKKVLTLMMLVKVPSGMVEADLARPVIELRDHTTKKLEYEIYSYGNENVILPVNTTGKRPPIYKLAEEQILKEFSKFTHQPNVEVISDNRAVVYVEEEDIPKIIGTGGRNIQLLEERLGIGIEIKEKVRETKEVQFDIKEDKSHMTVFSAPGQNVEIFADGKLIMTAFTSKKGAIRIHKQSQPGKDLMKALTQGRTIEIKA